MIMVVHETNVVEATKRVNIVNLVEVTIMVNDLKVVEFSVKQTHLTEKRSPSDPTDLSISPFIHLNESCSCAFSNYASSWNKNYALCSLDVCLLKPSLVLSKMLSCFMKS